jgi:hypothetical protein
MLEILQHRVKALAFRLINDSFAGDVDFRQNGQKHSFRAAFFGSLPDCVVQAEFLGGTRNEQQNSMYLTLKNLKKNLAEKIY